MGTGRKYPWLQVESREAVRRAMMVVGGNTTPGAWAYEGQEDTHRMFLSGSLTPLARLERAARRSRAITDKKQLDLVQQAMGATAEAGIRDQIAISRDVLRTLRGMAWVNED